MDYCKTRGLDRVKSNIELLVRYDEELGNKEKVTKDFMLLFIVMIKVVY